MKAPLHSLREAALAVVRRLHSGGFTALLAGGCVRDMLLGVEPKDYDVATNATPDQVCHLFPRARLVGAKFGVVIVRRHGFDIEVATFRTDEQYSDGRRPDRVRFSTPEEDARRRDFTVNGMFLDPLTDRVIDYVGGEADLRARIIRTIGEAALRFGEDHLRMLRAVRFAARLGFHIEPVTRDAIRTHADRLRDISPERVSQELVRMLTSPGRAEAWRLLLDTSLRSVLAPEWPPSATADHRAVDRLHLLADLVITEALAFSVVLIELGREGAARVCGYLRSSNRLCDDVVWLVDQLGMLRRAEPLELADVKLMMASPLWPDLLELLRVSEMVESGVLLRYGTIRRRSDAIRPADVAPPPLLTGEHLLSLGIPQGPIYTKILHAAHRAQLNETIHTTGEASAIARSIWEQRGGTRGES
jgi:poly(A) polymerase